MEKELEKGISSTTCHSIPTTTIESTPSFPKLDEEDNFFKYVFFERYKEQCPCIDSRGACKLIGTIGNYWDCCYESCVPLYWLKRYREWKKSQSKELLNEL